MMLQTLTQEQQNLIAMLKESLNLWPTSKPKRLHLTHSHYKTWKQILSKKKIFPHSVADVPIEQDKYDGVELICIRDELRVASTSSSSDFGST